MTEDEMVGCYHQLDGHEFEQAPGVGDGQGCRLAAVHRVAESDQTEQLNCNYILAWEIPCTREYGGLQSMWLQRVGHDLATKQ